MAEEKARNRLYAYSQNSNLVIDNRRRRGRRDGPGADEAQATGEARVAPLALAQMGDRVGRAAPPAAPPRRGPAGDSNRDSAGARDAGDADLAESDAALGSYRPRTRETRQVYEELLASLQRYLPGQPRDVLHNAVDEVLALAKDPEMTVALKLNEVRKLIGRQVDEQAFARLLRLSDAITDYSPPDGLDAQMASSSRESGADGTSGPMSSADVGVAVVFDSDDEDDDDSDAARSVVQDSESSDSEHDDGDDSDVDRGTRSRRRGADGEEDTGAGPAADGTVPVESIDAFWVQRQLAKYYEDANDAQRLAEEVLAILAEPDERACENRLVLLLEFDKFDLIKVLLQNRTRIWYCTRLKRAQSPAERDTIRAEMGRDTAPGGGAEILLMLEQPDDSTNASGRPGTNGGRAAAGASNKVRVVDADQNIAAIAQASTALGTTDVQPSQTIDLESLVFAAGDHTMSNKQVKLPKNAWRKQVRDFEEVHVPPPKPRPYDANERLVQISELPSFAQPAFAKMTALNRIQSRIYPTALNEDFNLLVCAPTGAGKTNVAVLTVLHEIGKYVDATGQVDIPRMKQGMKIVYVAPMKALVQEVVTNFSQRLGPAYNLVVRELSGDQQLSRAEIAETQIIVTTPEKWDVVTRKAGDRAYTQLVRLLIIDEIHLLHNERGAVLEAIIARTVRLQETSQQVVRIVGISATLPNYKDVATFCRVSLDRGLFFFDNSFRPVPLQQQYIGISETKPLKRFQKSNEICYDKVSSSLRRKAKDQILVFVHSRKETAASARALRDFAMEREEADLFINQDKPETKEALLSESENAVRNLDLKELLPAGLGIHHAGMPRSDRTLVEDMFKAGYIKVLVCTATLAWGVNLPAHTVIIKGTQVYNPEKGRWTELSQLDILQMLGRAGRPQYDMEGEGIIITTRQELQYYLSLMNEQLPIESQLIRRLADSLNAEIVMGTVQTLHDAARWLGFTYLYIRMLRNPTLYGIPADQVDLDPTLLQRRVDMCHSAALMLVKAQLIRYDRRTGYLQVTPLGRIASHYYITYGSMQRFNDFLRPSMGDIDLFRALSLSKEFANIVVRDDEKVELAQLAERAPIPIKESVDEPSAKVNLLLQSYISGLRLEGFALACDLVYIQQSASRIVCALFEIALARGWASLAQRTLELANMVDHRMWPTQLCLRQFSGVPVAPQLLKRIERHNLVVADLFALSPQELGTMSGQGIAQGRQLHRTIHCFPRLELSAQVQPITRSTLRVELTITPDFEFDEALYGSVALPFWIIVEDGDGENILHHEQLVLTAANSQDEHETQFVVPLSTPLPPHYFCRVVCDRFLQSVTVLPISFSKLQLPEPFPPPTELLDLRPVVADRAVEEAAAAATADNLDDKFCRRAVQIIVGERFDKLNPIQTQAFPALVQSNDSLFLGAPSGSGKTLVAELAIARAFAANPRARCVYVVPNRQVVHQRLVEWTSLFQRKLGVAVGVMTGETTADARLMVSPGVVLATPEAWDNLSRRWKKRRDVREVDLFIADDLHMVGSSQRPVYEVVVSRMRFISSSTGRPRIVGLGTSVANGEDLAGWIGASKQGCVLNFHPSTRPSRLEVELRGFELNHFGTRMLAMARPAFDAVAYHISEGARSAIVYVPSRRQAKVTAVDLVTFAAAQQREAEQVDGEALPPLFANPSGAEQLARHISKVRDAALARTLEMGVGYLYEGMAPSDRAVVEACFEAGVARVMIVTSSLCWGLTHRAPVVLIMGATRYDSAAAGYVDYPVAEVLKMVGTAASSSGGVAKCLLFCQTRRKAFYKKFMHDPLPVESHLHLDLADPLCAEIVSGVVQNKQEAVDYLTWSLFYRRLTKNPNYYNLLGTDDDILSDYLSELVENTLAELDESKCIAVDDNDMDLSPLNFGMIATHYYVQHTTIKLFAANLRAQSKLRRVLDVLVSAEEFEEVPVRQGEEGLLAALSKRLPVPLTEPDFAESRIKAHVLLQLHFSRRELSADQREDLNKILDQALRLLQAMVDILSSNGWLRPALAAMELSQMLVQARWNTDSPLLQIPHFNKEIVARCNAAGVKRVEDIGELEEDKLNEVLGLGPEEMQEAADFCNSYPDLDLQVAIKSGKTAYTGEPVVVEAVLERVEEEEDNDEDGGEGEDRKRKREDEPAPAKVYGKVIAPFYPKPKVEAYWLVIGDPKENTLLSIKKVSLAKQARFALEFDAPKSAGEHELKLYLMCDSVQGVDQVVDVRLHVEPSVAGDGAGSSSGSGSESDSD